MLTTKLHAPPAVELVNVTKRFGSFVANEAVSLRLDPGTFHALVGENGAGKSTLVKCIMGYHRADDGDIVVDGSSRDINSPHDANRLGIGMVYQHFTVVPAMTVAENFLLGRSDLPALLDWREENRKLSAFLEKAPFRVDLKARISSLAAGEKQKVEILKQLYLGSKVLILDEPTSVLTPQEADEVLGMLRKMVDQGELSILLITHKFREVTGYCDEVTVLRKGRVAGGGRVSDLSVSAMATLMMGEQRQGKTIEKEERVPGLPLLQIKGLRADRDSGVEAVRGIDLTVRSGEIVGIAGISGNGQRELVEVLGGQRVATAGEIRLQGQRFGGTRREMFRHRINVLPEEPLHNACAGQMSVAENLALRSFETRPLSLGGWLLSYRQIRAQAADAITRYQVKTPGPDSAIGTLSGGNIQRAVLARELGAGTTRILVAANPCFGLDFAAVDFVHSQLIDARNHGVAVLLICEDLDELLSLSDRVLVMAAGRLVYEAPVSAVSVKEIGEKMAGH
ncbi:MAG: ABC transporter ATP-binding protein [Verrucomicrobia bacterium]|nr:ABC transporter ATP-binding protein [Verrucomicrobiota bacterium]